MKLSGILILGAAALAAALPQKTEQSKCGQEAGKCLKWCGGWRTNGCWRQCKEETLQKYPALCKNYYFGPAHPVGYNAAEDAGGPMSIAARAPEGGIEFDFEEFVKGIASGADMAEGPIDCNECHRRYHNCVGLAFVPGLKACEKVCRIRVQDTDEVCKSCPDAYPNYILTRPPVAHPRN